MTAGSTALGHPQRVAYGKVGMVSSAHWCASEAGARMFAQGGNAVDAAVATALALGVCEPAASGLGGQTMMLIHVPGDRTLAIDGSSRAPNRTPPSELEKHERLRGHRATTVPSTPAVLAYVLERHGRLSWSTVLEPAIELAEGGYPVSELQHKLTVREQKHLAAGTAARFFLQPDGQPNPVGATLRQPVLAGTLRRLQQHGVADFYSGDIARAIASDMQQNGGLIQLDDLAQVPTPIERRPIGGRFGGMRIFTFPPPGAGRALLFILKLLDQFAGKRRRPDSVEGAMLIAEVIRRGMLERRDRPFDPSFYPQVQDRRMLDDDYAQMAARQIKGRLRQKPPPRTSGETTHLSTMDGDGCTVALTQSIERVYGSFAASPELGFLYNNYMSAFEHSDISHPYFLRPNAVPWASVAPTIVMQGKRPRLVLGSPGSERIVSALAQVLLRFEEGQSLLDAITAPRLHATLGGKVMLEASRMRADLPAAFERHGLEVQEVDPFSFQLGCVQAVQRDKDGLVGVADVRRDGAAVGA